MAFAVRIFLNKLAEKAQKTKNLWDDALVTALQLPCRLLIWLIGISLSADLVAPHAKASISLLTGQIRAVGVIVILAWCLVTFLKAFETNLSHPTDASQ